MAESKFDEESKCGLESKSGDIGDKSVKRLNSLLVKRENGDVLHNLYPFYQSKIAHGLEDFYKEYAFEFDDDEEHKLVYFDIFKKYEELFEGYLEEFIEEQQLDKKTFYEELNDVVEQRQKGRSQILVKLVAAQTDYDFFVNLMKDKARELRSTGNNSARANKK